MMMMMPAAGSRQQGDGPRHALLAFDIETLGLLHEEPLPEITCVCLHDGERDYAFQLWQLPTAEERSANVGTIVALLDGAERLLGYNAVLFDLEFIRRAFGIPDAQMQRWVLKCLDPFLFLRHVLGETCRLQRLLELNGLGSKTGTGGNAITLARDGRWDELLAYCCDDARLTYQLCTHREWVRLTPALECRLLSFPPLFRLAAAGTRPSSTTPVLVQDDDEPLFCPWPVTDTFASLLSDDDEEETTLKMA